MTIPVVEIGAFEPGTERWDRFVGELDAALTGHGFVALEPVDDSCPDVSALLAAADAFFAEPIERRMAFLWRDAGDNFGYQPVGAEALDPATTPDLKETFTMRNLRHKRLEADRWPSVALRDAADDFYERCFAMANQLMRALSQALGTADEFFTSAHSGQNVTLRVLHYPGQAPSADDQRGAGAHTDYGLLTLLFQDGVSGLEVVDARDQWIPVPAHPGRIVVNSGDLLERWTNGRYRSTCHRVAPVTDRRRSVAFFVDPDDATAVACLDSCTRERAAQWPPTTAGEHIRQKLEASIRIREAAQAQEI